MIFLLNFRFLFPGAQVLTVSPGFCLLTLTPSPPTHCGSSVMARNLSPLPVVSKLSPPLIWCHLSFLKRGPMQKALVFKNTLHTEVLCVHIHTYIPPHIHTCEITYTQYTEHWFRSAAAGYSQHFPCAETPFPSLDPAQSCLLSKDLSQTKTPGKPMMKTACDNLLQRLRPEITDKSSAAFIPSFLSHSSKRNNVHDWMLGWVWVCVSHNSLGE